MLLPPLLAELRQTAPGIDVSILQLLPAQGETSPERAWRSVFVDLQARAMDIAIIPSDEIPMRFLKHAMYEENFVVAMRAGHPFGMLQLWIDTARCGTSWSR